jgi:bifunctional non-homologous end joining protein LigD
VKPQLAALVKEASDGADWLHEIKFDGYRMHARLDAGRANNPDPPGERLDARISRGRPRLGAEPRLST